MEGTLVTDMADPFSNAKSVPVDPRDMYRGTTTAAIPTSDELGRRLRALREREGISIEEVARRVGRDPEAIATFEAEGEASAALLLDLLRTMTSSSSLTEGFRHPRFSTIEQVIESGRRTFS